MLLVVGLRNGLELGNEVLTETGLGTGIETAEVDELIDHCLGSSSNRIGFSVRSGRPNLPERTGRILPTGTFERDAGSAPGG
jgi:hypothetical protein